MEKKTIGGFIAALRRASGMTQLELARKLNVSDKTVSRWERNESMPDLSVIPVLAEIFGVSCDELLRGERNAANAPEFSSPKGEKQRRHLAKLALTGFENRSCIAMGLCLLGLIAALICDLVFTQGRLGFLCGSVFVLAGAVCQSIFLRSTLRQVEGSEPECASVRKKVILRAEVSFGLSLGVLAFTLPLLLCEPYTGLSGGSLLLGGLACAAASGIAGSIGVYFLNAALLKRSVFTLPEKEAAAFWHNHRLKRYFAAFLTLSLALSVLAHLFSVSCALNYAGIRGTVFEDYESFVAFMEQDVRADGSTGSASFSLEPLQDGDAEEIVLRDRSGKEVCHFTMRNESVTELSYTPGDGTVLPITVYTQAHLSRARANATVCHILFAVLYTAQIVAALLLYRQKRQR